MLENRGSCRQASRKPPSHLGRPVTKGIRDQLENARMREVHRISGPSIVDVIALLVGQQPVVARIVDALER